MDVLECCQQLGVVLVALLTLLEHGTQGGGALASHLGGGCKNL